MVFLRYPFQCSQKFVHFSKSYVSYCDLKERISSILKTEDFLLYCNGKKLCDWDFISNDSSVEITFALLGGKGGFGSMLRAIGAQIEKTTNREACRDLSGRRLRDINEEQRLKRWIAKKAEREEDKIRRRKERLERLKSKPKHNFVDFNFEKEISTLPGRVDDALTEGMQKTKNLPVKREASETAVLSKRKRVWVDEEMLSDSSSSDSELQKNNSSSESNELASINDGYKSSKSKNFDPNCPGTSGLSESCSSFEIRDSEYEENVAHTGDCENSNLSDAYYKNKGETKGSESEESTADSRDFENSNLSDSHCKNKEETTDSSNEENRIYCMEYEDSNCASEVSCGYKIEETVTTNLDSSLQNEVKESGAESTPKLASSLLNILPPPKEQEKKDEEPVDLMSYQKISELEALGLDCLKAALIYRGLKCGGNISDRAQRLWRVRGLQPHEYPANLRAKNKK